MNHYINLGSTIRYCSAAQTLSKVGPLIDRFGITRIANITGLDNIGIPVAIAIRPNAKHLSVSQGKGATWELAKTSAIMESIEGYHAENPPLPKLFGSYVSLAKNHPVISPSLFHHGFLTTSTPHSWELGWIEAVELHSRASVFIPHTLISLDSTQCQPNYALFSVTSNGLASGNHINEAITHALYEVIERDALYHWHQLSQQKKQHTKIAISTIKSNINQCFLQKIQTAGLTAYLWDITSAVGVPSYCCQIKDPDRYRDLGEFTGSGTHLSKEVALARAITEAAQTRLTLISGSRDDVFPAFYRQRRTKHVTTDPLNQTHLEGNLDFENRTTVRIHTSFEEDIQIVLNYLKQKGFKQVFVVNHTKAKTNIPVVHLFVPGLQNS